MENTDTISNVHSLKELLARKGLNLRFEWLLLTRLKTAAQRELTMVHILVRIIKKVVNEELKLKAQVFTPNKAKLLQAQSPAEHHSGPGAA